MSEIESASRSSPTPVEPGDAQEATRAQRSVERLRERTDELELIISGLTTVALFALPDWLFERFTEFYAHLPVAIYAGAMLALPLIMALAYTLGVCFLLHLGVRAYWVGLIGLSAVFPQGIRWDQARGIGPLSQARLQASVPPMAQAISNANRLASILFSLISLSALTLLWLGVLGTALFMAAASVGSAIGATNTVLALVSMGAVGVVLAAALLVFLLDAVLARRYPVLQQSSWLRGSVRALSLVVRMAIPERLIAPVRLTLQTNTWPRLFSLAFVLLILLVPFFSIRLFQSHFAFDPLGNQRFIGNTDTTLRSPHYESRRQPEDRVRAWPIIPDLRIEGRWLPLFLPYLPLRDDIVLQQRCAATDTRAQADKLECLTRIWRVFIDDQPMVLTQAHLSERRDLGYRGLSVWLDLRTLSPGPHELRIIWRPEPEQDLQLDDYLSDSQTYRIPFLWDPQP